MIKDLREVDPLDAFTGVRSLFQGEEVSGLGDQAVRVTSGRGSRSTARRRAWTDRSMRLLAGAKNAQLAYKAQSFDSC